MTNGIAANERNEPLALNANMPLTQENDHEPGIEVWEDISEEVSAYSKGSHHISPTVDIGDSIVLVQNWLDTTQAKIQALASMHISTGSPPNPPGIRLLPSVHEEASPGGFMKFFEDNNPTGVPIGKLLLLKEQSQTGSDSSSWISPLRNNGKGCSSSPPNFFDGDNSSTGGTLSESLSEQERQKGLLEQQDRRYTWQIPQSSGESLSQAPQLDRPLSYQPNPHFGAPLTQEFHEGSPPRTPANRPVHPLQWSQESFATDSDASKDETFEVARELTQKLMLAFTEAGDAVDAVAAAEGSGLLPGFGTPKQGSENDMPEEDEGLENESSEDESSDDEIYDEIYDDNSSNHSHDSDPFVNRQVIPSSRSNDGDVQDDEELPSTLHVENIAALPRLATPSAEAPMQNLPRGDSNYTSGTVIHRHAEVAAAMMGVDGPYCSHNSGVHIDRSSSSEESPTEAFLRRRKVRRGRHENQLPGLDRGA